MNHAERLAAVLAELADATRELGAVEQSLQLAEARQRQQQALLAAADESASLGQIGTALGVNRDIARGHLRRARAQRTQHEE